METPLKSIFMIKKWQKKMLIGQVSSYIQLKAGQLEE